MHEREKMKPEIQKLHSVWELGQKSRQKTSLPAMKFDEIVSQVFSAGPTYHYVVDFFDMSVTHMSPMVKEIHGLDPQTAAFNDILNLVHPDDMNFVSKAEAKAVEIFEQIGRDKFTRYKVSYCIRFKTIDGTYKLFLHQSIILTIDEHLGFSKALNIHTDISHFCTDNNYKISLIGLSGEPSFTDIAIESKTGPEPEKLTTYSKREVEILKLIADGFTNADIAGKLNIALDTVKNHRRNILEKAGVKNTAQLIRKSMLEGLI